MKLIKIFIIGLALIAGNTQSMQQGNEFGCLYCTKMYKASTGAIKHSNKEHADQDPGYVRGDTFYPYVDPTANSSVVDGEYHCELCSKKCESLKDIAIHLAKAHSDPIKVESISSRRLGLTQILAAIPKIQPEDFVPLFAAQPAQAQPVFLPAAIPALVVDQQTTAAPSRKRPTVENGDTNPVPAKKQKSSSKKKDALAFVPQLNVQPFPSVRVEYQGLFNGPKTPTNLEILASVAIQQEQDLVVAAMEA